MRKVIGIGETVLDIIFKDNKPVNAVPGGSALNAIVSLSRAGISADFIGEVGHDRVGSHILDFLKDNHVGVSKMEISPEGQSHLSLAFLDEENNADYLFYKDHVHDLFSMAYPEINRDDIVLFGSFFAVNPIIHAEVNEFLKFAQQKGAILYYDVNFRPSHRHEVMKITPNFIDNLELSTIVRGSHEDFEVLYKQTDAAKVYQNQIKFYCKNFIYTRGDKPVSVFATPQFQKDYDVPALQPVSTIGAGDNFNAGIIYGLLKEHITLHQIEEGLSAAQWDALIGYAQAFSAACCQDIYNYVSEAFGQKMSM